MHDITLPRALRPGIILTLCLALVWPLSVTATVFPEDSMQLEEIHRLHDRALNGDTDAAFMLGMHYAGSAKGISDHREAVRWLQQAAEQGHHEAQANLGVIYATGHAGVKDLNQALYWYQKAAEQGNAAAQYNLGSLFLGVENIPRDDERASRWLHSAALQGMAQAQYNYALMLQTGRATPLGDETVRGWLEKAAAQKLAPAQELLASLPAESPPAPQDVAATPAAASPPGQVRATPVDANGSATAGLRSTAWLASQDPDAFVLQVGSFIEPERAVDLIRRFHWEQQAAHFRAYGRGKSTGPINHSVVYGVYASHAEALAAVQGLPERIRHSRPWVRNMGDIQEMMLADGGTLPVMPSAGEIHGPQWLAAQSAAEFTLQLATLPGDAESRRFIRRHGIQAQAAYFAAEVNGERLYSVVYGSYPSHDAATEAIASLPEALRKTQPWVRRFGYIQSAMESAPR